MILYNKVKIECQHGYLLLLRWTYQDYCDGVPYSTFIAQALCYIISTARVAVLLPWVGHIATLEQQLLQGNKEHSYFCIVSVQQQCMGYWCIFYKWMCVPLSFKTERGTHINYPSYRFLLEMKNYSFQKTSFSDKAIVCIVHGQGKPPMSIWPLNMYTKQEMW